MHTFHARTLAVAFAAGTFALAGCRADDAPSTMSAHDAEPPVEADPATGSPLPTTDAAAVRDELLELAAAAPFGQTGSGPDFTIVTAWLEVHPGLARTLFDDQPADPATISSSSAFLMEDLRAPGDQAFAWAVADLDGECAAAVALIPGNPDGSVSDSGRPTVFAPVDDPATCSARGALEAFAAAG